MTNIKNIAATVSSIIKGSASAIDLDWAMAICTGTLGCKGINVSALCAYVLFLDQGMSNIDDGLYQDYMDDDVSDDMAVIIDHLGGGVAGTYVYDGIPSSKLKDLFDRYISPNLTTSRRNDLHGLVYGFYAENLDYSSGDAYMYGDDQAADLIDYTVYSL